VLYYVSFVVLAVFVVVNLFNRDRDQQPRGGEAGRTCPKIRDRAAGRAPRRDPDELEAVGRRCAPRQILRMAAAGVARPRGRDRMSRRSPDAGELHDLASPRHAARAWSGLRQATGMSGRSPLQEDEP